MGVGRARWPGGWADRADLGVLAARRSALGRHPAPGLGLGARLLAEAERTARTERACTRSRLETWDFQAPGFYRRQGYEEIGRVADYPPGVTEFILVKEL